MASIPLEGPLNIVIAQVGTDTLHITWDGDATVYKLAYKREENTAWTSVAQTGIVTTGGSGEFTDDSPTAVAGPPGASADFSISGLTPGVYDLRIMNKGGDDSDYTVRRKALIEVPVGIIPNLRIVKLAMQQIKIAWDTPIPDSGEPIIVTWCEINQFRQKLNCDSEQLATTARSYTIVQSGADHLMIFVSQRVNDYQDSVSEALYVEICPCNDGSGNFTIQQEIVGEVLAGAVDGVNTVFTSVSNMVEDSERVMVNGLTQTRFAHYTIASGNEVHFVDPPEIGDVVSADYKIDVS